MDVPELAALANMLREWYRLRVPSDGGRSGRIWCEARIYAIPRAAADGIRQAIAARLPDCDVRPATVDELVVRGPARNIDVPADLRVWHEVLAEPAVQHACVRLRITIQGPVIAADGFACEATQSFILCGAPASGAIRLKAIWEFGGDESAGLLYEFTAWTAEARFLDAFDTYSQECAAGRAVAAASAALRVFGKYGKRIFLSSRDERHVMWIARQIVELPDDRGPGGFARRLAIPLAGAVGLTVIPAVSGARVQTTYVCMSIAAVLVLLACWVVGRKLSRVWRYYRGMRTSLGTLYSAPAKYQLIDLSSDRTATLLKCSADFAELGAQQVCDVRVEAARSMFEARIFVVGDATASLTLLRTAESFVLFPAKPIIMIETRFADGRRHCTTNRAIYRKQSRAHVTVRCLPESGGATELCARHRRHVDRLIAGGAVPVPPDTIAERALERIRADDDADREAWQRSPYSWGDALHQAFRMCRREYLVD